MMVKTALSIAALLAAAAVPRPSPLARGALSISRAAPSTAHASNTAPRTAQPAPRTAPSGLILGRVVDAVSGQPVSSAVVRLSAAGSPAGAGVLTGADGRFVFSPVSAGTFTLTAERPGYFDGAYGVRRPMGQGMPFTIAAGERRGDATIRMWPWASIAGTVVDEIGHRVPGVPVDAIRRLADGTLAPEGGGSAVTDTRGEYRIQHLVPGTYVVAAGCRSTSVGIPPSLLPTSAALGGPVPGTAPGDPTVILDATHHALLAVTGPVRQARDARERAHPFVYVTSYYGGATDLWQATGLTVTLGQQLTGIDFALSLKPSVRIAGAVVGPRGPVAQAFIRLLPTDLDPTGVDTTTPDVVAAVTGDDGSFTLPAVPVGNYLLDAYRPHLPAAGGRPPGAAPQLADVIGIARLDGVYSSSRDTAGYWSRMSLVVNGRDIPDLLVTMRAGARLSGETSFQRPVSSPDGGPTPTFRVALAHGDDPPVTSASIRMDRPGPFEITGARPGWYVLEAVGLPAGWEIASAVLGGRDITGTPFEVGGSDLGGLVLTLGNRPSEVRGEVLDAQGRLVRDATIVVFPVDVANWKVVAPGATHLQSIRAVDGGYAFRGLAAGDYYVAAVDDAVMADWPSPELLRKFVGGATRVSVAAGERRVINITTRPGR